MGKPLDVLIVEDSEDDALLMVRVLQKGGYEPTFTRVETAAAMRDALAGKPWDLILSDYDLPQFNGLEALTVLKERNRDIPFILVSGAIGEETAVAAMKAGAHDYIMKEKLQRLIPAVERELREVVVRRERARAAAALRASEETFTTVFQHSPVAMAVATIEEGLLLDINDAYLRLTGYDREAITGHTAGELGLWVDPEDRGRVIAEVTLHQRIQGYPIRLRTKSGEIIHLLFSAERVTIGGTPCLLSSAIDISERLQAEERYRSLFENAPLGIVQVTPQGRIIVANRAMAQMLGYDTPEEMVESVRDVGLELFLRPEDRQRMLAVVAEQERITGYDLQWRRRDGRVIWLSANVRTILDASGAIICYEGLHEDITARKQAEADRQESIARLRKTLAATVLAMAVVVETRDPYTAGHQRRTADLSAAIAAEMGLDAALIEGIRMAGLIHDLGKLAVPAEILSKPTKLSTTEFSLIKVHSQAGYDILKEIEFPWPIARMILEHHERLDGSGYPRGLRGKEATLQGSRILQVADVVESMASYRPYRPALGVDAALREIGQHREDLYDGAVVDACIRLFREKGFTWDQGEGEGGEGPAENDRHQR